MSFILDALRKSESERQRDAPPTLARAPLAPARPRVPVWIWVLIAVLSAALIALGAVWWQSREGGAADTSPAAPAVPGEAAIAERQPRAIETAPVAASRPGVAASSGTEAQVRPINELPSFGPALPDYRLELLAFNAADPAASWARINGRRYAAGDRIGGGPELMEIRADGVVLGYAGERFLLTAR